jgi:phosphoenolpyruvate carboxylase
MWHGMIQRALLHCLLVYAVLMCVCGLRVCLQVREVLDTMRTAARLGSGSLGAYVISMSQAASDVLAVELLQKEARLMVRSCRGVL